MKKRFLIISLIIGLFLIVSAGIAMAAPEISPSPASKDFGDVLVDSSVSQTFTISNTDPDTDTTATLAIKGVYLTGSNPFKFSIQNDTCAGAIIAQSESCTVDVDFSPTLTGAWSATLGIDSNDLVKPKLEIGLSAAGVVYTSTSIHTDRVKIEPSDDVNIPTLYIFEPTNNVNYYPNDAIPLKVEGAENLNTVLVIKSSGYKNDDTTKPTEAELQFNYRNEMNAAIYTQGDDHILRFKPLFIGTEPMLQEVQIEGDNQGDINLRIAAKGDSDAALTFAKNVIDSNRDAIDTAKIYRPADSYDLSVWMNNYYGDIMTFSSDYHSIAMGYNTTANGYVSTAMGAYTNAIGPASTAMGSNTTANGYASTAMGYSTTANRDFSTAMGRNITVEGQTSFGIGLDYIISNASTITQDNTMAIMGGNVGIGTVSPGEKLEVNGNAKISSLAGSGNAYVCVDAEGMLFRSVNPCN